MTKETIALGIPVFEAVKAKAYYAHQEFLLALASEVGRLWLLRPLQARMTFPFCVRWIVSDMFHQEKESGIRADWFVWLEDDILPPADGYARLRAVADPVTRPFVAALAYARNPPYNAAIMPSNHHGPLKDWPDHPTDGTHPVDRVGMGFCIIHRSVFDRIAEPWFEVDPPVHGKVGYGPDASFSRKLMAGGIQPHVCYDVSCGHLTDGIVMDRKTIRMLTVKPGANGTFHIDMSTGCLETPNGLSDSNMRR